MSNKKILSFLPRLVYTIGFERVFIIDKMSLKRIIFANFWYGSTDIIVHYNRMTLFCKVAELEKQVDVRKRIAAGGSLESASSEQAERLEKEIRDQEKLLAGYQSENERLYQDMKKIQGETKATQERMFRENERLKTEVRSLK